MRFVFGLGAALVIVGAVVVFAAGLWKYSDAFWPIFLAGLALLGIGLLLARLSNRNLPR